MPGQVAETPRRRGHDRQRNALGVVMELHLGKRAVRFRDDAEKTVAGLTDVVHGRGDTPAAVQPQGHPAPRESLQ
jgi:hypothetical protein